MSWFLVILFLMSLTFGADCEMSHDKKKLPSAVVVGTVYCDTCFQQDFSMGTHFISGASVAVECKDGNSNPSFREEVKTNEHGEFRVQLPFSVSKHVKRIKGCMVKLISSSEPYCAVASSATSSSLHLKSRKQGLHIFTAGFFSFKPLKQPSLCNQKPTSTDQNTKGLDFMKNFFPPLEGPNVPLLPPLPKLPGLPPMPQLPPLPPLPGLPMPWSPPHVPKKMTNEANPTKNLENGEILDQKEAHLENFIIPPNPLLPPPIVPNPLEPPPLVPDPSQPPIQPPVFPMPPGLTPTPSTPPFLPSPFPPLLPPPPSSTGTPPASSSNNASP